MNQLNSYLREIFYTPLLPCLLALIAIGLDLRGRPRGMKYFKLYFICYLLGLCFVSFVALQSDKPYYIALIHSVYVVDLSQTIIEFLVFFRFIQISLGGRHRRTFQLIRFLFLLTVLVLLVKDLLRIGCLDLDTMHIVFTLQAVSLLIGCLLYYKNIYRFMPVLSLRSEPTFWVVTGLSFMLTCTFPLSLFEGYIDSKVSFIYKAANAIFYIFYSLFFLMIIRAYLCTPSLTKS